MQVMTRIRTKGEKKSNAFQPQPYTRVFFALREGRQRVLRGLSPAGIAEAPPPKLDVYLVFPVPTFYSNAISCSSLTTTKHMKRPSLLVRAMVVMYNLCAINSAPVKNVHACNLRHLTGTSHAAPKQQTSISQNDAMRDCDMPVPVRDDGETLLHSSVGEIHAKPRGGLRCSTHLCSPSLDIPNAHLQRGTASDIKGYLL